MIYFNTNGVCVMAYACESGKREWKTDLPRKVDADKHPQGGWWAFDRLPKGYDGHMGPGGTPVPMTLRDEMADRDVEVVVIPNGHVLRVSDGTVLGWFDSFRRETDINKAQTYGTGVAVGDIYVSVHAVATRLSLQDGRLRAERLWVGSGRTKSGHKSDVSLIAGRGEVFTSRGQAWHLLTGETLRRGIKMRGSHGKVSGCLSAGGLMVWRGAEYGNHAITFGLGETTNPRQNSDRRGGYGVIVEGRYPEAIRQNFIDRFGKSRIHLGWAHPTAFGNRIFVRTNAYLYCFGKGKWNPPRRRARMAAERPTRDRRTGGGP